MQAFLLADYTARLYSEMLYACLYPFGLKIPIYNFVPVFNFLGDDVESKVPCDDGKFILEMSKSDQNYVHVSCEILYTKQVLD